ncbi:MAG: Lrp/AsnC ligand binding domain-containing protein [Nitrososphaerales archaeon]|nr:Lrp/AsnC ligand binding domain-containing protein [Nitrososphaerales archaeon]
MKACLLIKTQPTKFDQVRKHVRAIKGIKVAFSVLGRTDVVANVEVTSLKELSTLALEMGSIDGVLATETLIGLEA